MSASKDLRAFEDGCLYLFTSLTAGSSHIITATSRLETILKANKIPFQAIDIATDEQARRLWQRRAQKKKLPGLVKDGYVIGDLEEIEEWNEFGELRENIGEVRLAPPSGGRSGINIRPVDSSVSPRQSEDRADVPHPNASKTASALVDSTSRVALPGAAEIAARNKAKSQSPPLAKSPPAIESVASPPDDKEQSGDMAKEPSKPSSPTDDIPAPVSQPIAPVSGSLDGASEDGIVRKHRGSDVQIAPPEEIKKIESENALHEDPAEEELEEATHRVESVTFDDEPVKPQD